MKSSEPEDNQISEEELKEHYQQMQNGMDKRFKWLTVDYSTPYAHELEKRISMLREKTVRSFDLMVQNGMICLYK